MEIPAGAKAGLLTLVGAGELMPAMSAAHRDALSQLRAPARALFLDTTAGFESNVDAITGKAVDYYNLRLQTKLEVASYRHAGRASWLRKFLRRLPAHGNRRSINLPRRAQILRLPPMPLIMR